METPNIADLAVAGLVNNQAATLVCDSDLFAPVRRRAEAANPWLGDLVNCHICFGMWAALAHAAYRQLTNTAPRRGPIAFLLDALAIAGAGRLLRRLINPEP